MPLRPPAGFIRPGFDPLKNPNAPTIGVAVEGNQSASIFFTPPVNAGGSAITLYQAITDTNGVYVQNNTSANSPISVTGLTNGTPYTSQVWAQNTYGPSAFSSASNTVTPALPSFMLNLYTGSVQSVTTDSSNNIIMLGWDTYNQHMSIAKYTNAGVLVWQKRTDVSNGQSNRIAISSSGNIVAGNINNGQQRVFVYDSNGELIWQRMISGWPGGCSGARAEHGAGVCFDSAGNVYLGSPVYYACLYGYTLNKFNSSGTLQWSRTFTNNVRSNPFTTIVADSAGGVYFTTGKVPGGGYYSAQLVKVNSFDGTTIWNRTVDVPCNYPSSYGEDLALDSSGNVYMSGVYGTSSFVAKYNSSGTNQWVKQIDFGSQSYSYGVGVDTSGNVYVSGYYLFDYKMYMIKLNSSGVTQWQRHITANTGGWKTYGQDAHVDSSGSPIFVATANNAAENRMFLIKPPSDGSKTGTYTLSGLSWNYGASSANITTASAVLSSSGPANASINLNSSVLTNVVSPGGLSTGTTIL